MTRARTIVTCCGALLIPLLAACSSDDDGDAASTAASTAATAPESVTAQATTPSTPLPDGVEPLDLTAFAAAWSSGDTDEIRSFYTPDAVYGTPEQTLARQAGEPVSTSVADPEFANRVAERYGMQMRLVGQPFLVQDKLGAFLFRFETPERGFDGAAVLRFEGDSIAMHTYVLDPTADPNPPTGSDPVTPYDVSELLTWAGGTDAVLGDYTADPIVLNDEDIVLVDRDPTHVSTSVESEIEQVSVMSPEALGPAQRIDGLAVVPWRLTTVEAPTGYGVRLLVFDADLVSTDVRYVRRPWEVDDATFLSGY